MGWGIPAEDIKYVMMKFPEVAPNLDKWYRVQWQQFPGTALGVQGLAAGTLDCATVGGLSVANGIDQGANITLLGEFIEERQPNFSTAWMVKTDSGINSLADLKGKIVATSAIGGSTDYVQDFYIKQKTGLLPNKDYKKVEVPFGQMVETLLSGRADMGLYPQPFYNAINATGKVKPMFRLTDEIDPFVQLLNACRKEFVDGNQETIRKFQEDWVTVARWMADPANRDRSSPRTPPRRRSRSRSWTPSCSPGRTSFVRRTARSASTRCRKSGSSSASRTASRTITRCATTCRHSASSDAELTEAQPAASLKIEARGVCKLFESPRGQVRAIDGIDLVARAGEFISIVGPSGCGKSTFLYIVGGFVKASGGTLTVDGAPVQRPDPSRGIVFQEFVLFPWKTVLGNVMYGLAERGVPRRERRERAQAFIDMVHLSGFEKHSPRSSRAA